METAVDSPNKDLICSGFFFFNSHDLNTLHLISARKWRGIHSQLSCGGISRRLHTVTCTSIELSLKTKDDKETPKYPYTRLR